MNPMGRAERRGKNRNVTKVGLNVDIAEESRKIRSTMHRKPQRTRDGARWQSTSPGSTSPKISDSNTPKVEAEELS